MEQYAESANQALLSFAEHANWSALHHKDLERFDDFTIAAYEEGGWSPQQVREELSKYMANNKINKSMVLPVIEKLIENFEIGIRILERYKALPPLPSACFRPEPPQYLHHL